MRVWYKLADPTKVISFGKTTGLADEGYFNADWPVDDDLDHDHYRIVDLGGGTLSLSKKPQSEIDEAEAAKNAAEALKESELSATFTKLKQRIDNTQYADVDGAVEAAFANHTTAQRNLLKDIIYICLHYGKTIVG